MIETESDAFMAKQKTLAIIRTQNQLAEDIYDLRLETKLSAEARPGQFVSVYVNDASRLLPRPISICKVEDGVLRLVYRLAGGGTRLLSQMKPGESVQILGVLGNGFMPEAADGKRVLVMGGGIGIPPMLQTAISLRERGKAQQIGAVLGYRSERFLMEEFEEVCPVYAATEDGSFGSRGNVMDAIREQKLSCDVIMACGPMPMLRAVKEYAAANHIRAYISLEERMACGVGACLGCVCKTSHKDAHSQVNNSRICTDGPVYAAEDVLI